MRKQYIELPLPIKCGILRQLWQALAGILLMPWYLMIAWILKTPGITLHFKCVILALRLLFSMRISLRKCFELIYLPMDSTRYFEFHELFNSLAHISFRKYLDVSSPRLVPLIIIKQNKAVNADVINPDVRDLQATEQLADALGLTDRCRFTNSKIETAEFVPGTFDLITCISVLEHIPSDRDAVDKMWSLLRPGGRLILTLPCRNQTLEQYINYNNYGVLSPGVDGYTFWQRYYDNERLYAVIYKITGEPVKMAVYGEKSNGLFYRNFVMKHLLRFLYPFWRESYMVSKEYRYFKTIDELPGEGVVMLEFVKL
jgi:SAM-dependent methyltransferase